MFFARSGVVAANLLVLNPSSRLLLLCRTRMFMSSRSASLCHTNEIAKNNACVSCASLYTNATTCSRSAPLTCSYGKVNSKRQCAAVDCSTSPATYPSADGKQCLPCTDPNALTCTGITTLSCNTDYTLLLNNTCVNQPFKPYTPVDGDAQNCARAYTKAKESFDPATCTVQNAPLDMNLVAANDPTAVVLVKGNCTLLAQSSYVKANKANCQQVFIGPQSTTGPKMLL